MPSLQLSDDARHAVEDAAFIGATFAIHGPDLLNRTIGRPFEIRYAAMVGGANRFIVGDGAADGIAHDVTHDVTIVRVAGDERRETIVWWAPNRIPEGVTGTRLPIGIQPGQEWASWHVAVTLRALRETWAAFLTRKWHSEVDRDLRISVEMIARRWARVRDDPVPYHLPEELVQEWGLRPPTK